MNLRPLRFADVGTAAKLFAESAVGELSAAGAEIPFLQLCERFGVSLKHSRLLESADGVVGVVLNAVQEGYNEIYTVHWAVRADVRGLGLGVRAGRKLIAEYAVSGYARGLAEVHEQNEAALRFCEWLGYRRQRVWLNLAGVLQTRSKDVPSAELQPVEPEMYLDEWTVREDLLHWRRRPGLMARQLLHADCRVIADAGRRLGGWAVSPGVKADLVERIDWAAPATLPRVLDALAGEQAGRTVGLGSVVEGSPLADVLVDRGLRVVGRWHELAIDLPPIRERQAGHRWRGLLCFL